MSKYATTSSLSSYVKSNELDDVVGDAITNYFSNSSSNFTVVRDSLLPNWTKPTTLTGRIGSWKILGGCWGLFWSNTPYTSGDYTFHIFVNEKQVTIGRNHRGSWADNSFNFIPLRLGDIIRTEASEQQIIIMPCMYETTSPLTKEIN